MRSVYADGIIAHINSKGTPVKYFFSLLIILSVLLSGCGGSLQKTAAGFSEKNAYQDGIDFFKNKFRGSDARAIRHFYIHRHVLYFYQKLGRLHDGLVYYMQFKDKALRAYIRGVYHEILSMNDKALKYLEEAVSLRPKEFIIHYDLALVQRALKKYGSARRSLARCLKLNGGYGPAYYEMGMHYAYEQRLSGIGRSFLKKAVDKYSDFGREALLDVRISLGQVLLRENKTDDALSIFEDIAEADFSKLIRSVDLGSLYVQVGKIEKARNFWVKALSLLGHDSIRGRYYFFKLHALRQGGVDLSGVGYGYVTTLNSGEESFVFADEEDFFFNNTPASPLTYKKLLDSGLSDGKLAWDVWIVEYAGIMTKAQPVHRFVQKRGVVSTLSFKDKRQLLVSVEKKKIEIGKTAEEGSRGTSFWLRSNAVLGVFSPTGGSIVKLPFSCNHFHRAFLQDVDGDGREDIVVSGFDPDGKLLVSVYLDTGRGRWKAMRPLSVALSSRDNGFVLADLDNKPGLELVRYSDVISWADIYRQKGTTFVKDATLYSGFAADFQRRYPFFVKGYTASLQGKTSPTREDRLRYLAYERYLPIATSMLKQGARP